MASTTSLTDRAFERLQGRAFQAAIGYFDDALESDPRDARALYGRALAWYSLEEWEEALAGFDAALDVDPASANALFGRGAVRSRQREFEAAIADYEATVRLEPDSPDVHLRLAQARAESDQTEAAIAAFSEAIRLDPRLFEAYEGRALQLEHQGDFQRAREDHDRAAELAAPRHSMQKQKRLISHLIREHFAPGSTDDLQVTQRMFPLRMRADLQRAVNDLFAGDATVSHFSGVLHRHGGLHFPELIAPHSHEPPVTAPPQYEEVDIGEEAPVRCLKNGLWLLGEGDARYAMLLVCVTGFHEPQGLGIQLAVTGDAEGARITQEIFAVLEEAVRRSRSYRGKILSLEMRDQYSGESSGITVVRLATTERDQVILPQPTLELLDRNVLSFAKQRPRLAELGLSTKKGLLFYGPPGTGKTHTIRYLAGALEGHTTLLITAEQVGLLDEYMTLARLLQPSIVVIEDVDLIAGDRDGADVCEEVLLNKMLNEIDGLQPDADILFIFTTNRPESLEAALASRPGRVDQAIEFPLPDSEGRARLIRLYARGLSLPDAVIDSTVRKTDRVSASFIKELMRRAAQFQIERGAKTAEVTEADIDDALRELLFTGGSLNRKLLGAALPD